MKTCTYPIGEAADPCRKKAVAIYIVGREEHPRCKQHDGASARQTAEDRGYERRSVAA